MKRQLPSILSPALKRYLKVLLIVAAFMLANSIYLLIYHGADSLNLSFFAASEIALPKIFQVMVLSHTGIGLILVPLLLVFAIAHLKKVWRRRHRSSIVSGISFVILGILILVTGLYILTAAASRDNQWAWWTHVICAVSAPAIYVIHRVVSYNRPKNQSFSKYIIIVGGLVLLIIGAHSFTNLEITRTKEAQTANKKGTYSGPGAKSRDVGKFNAEPFVPAGFVPPESPFFPSAATTTTGDYLPSRIITRDDLGSKDKLQDELKKHGFVIETKIGSETCERCHQDIVTQWATSAHRFASFNNPFYEATILDMRKNSNISNEWVQKHISQFPEMKGQAGIVKSKWCSGCHDPSLMLAGKMNKTIDRTWPEAQAGLTCLACHAIDKIHDQTGNGNYNIADEQEDPYLFADSKSGTIGAFLHDAALKAKPVVHKRQMLTPVFRSSEYCASCHKVSLRSQVNNYRWLRGQDEYDNWHDSGVALNASRTFYLPGKKRICQDCHMPLEAAPLGDVAAKNGFVKSHRFLAVNTALPFLRGDTATIKRIESFLQLEKLRVDIFAIKSDKKTYYATERTEPLLNTGEKIIADVVVRNLGVGHTFPGGTNDSNEGWLEFSLKDESGKILAISGDIDKNGHLDPMAHVYKVLLVDKSGNPINKRNAQDIHSTVFANIIGPGTSDIAHYEFIIPKQLTGKKITLQARLLWRKFDRLYTEFAYEANPEGFKQFSKAPDLPITEIASSTINFYVLPYDTNFVKEKKETNIPDWIRFNDYGIGLLLENDTRGATKAFEQVIKIKPESFEGPLNLAKTAFSDGNITKAYTQLKKCEQIEAGSARVAWVWGLVLQEDGQYDNAVLAYQRVLEQFPEDRATLRNLGRTYYLNQQYDESVISFNKVLEIDPEDRIAHYHKMLCYQALGMKTEFEKAKTAYEFYQIDESAPEVTREFRLKNPGSNLMTQAVKTHKLLLEND